MLSIYEITKQGQGTRSHLLAILQHQDGLTRNEIVERSLRELPKESHLTYEQVRRQTRNLVIAGLIESQLIDGQRRYFAVKKAINPKNAALLAMLFVVWIPFYCVSIEFETIRISDYKSIGS